MLSDAAFAFSAAEARQSLQKSGSRARLQWREQTESTNRWAMDEAEHGAPAYSWYAADSQTAGRGRLGRTWVSPPGRNLYVSCVLRPRISLHQAPQVSLAAGIAVHRALADCGVQAGIKWPNDLQIGGRKVSGILNEIRALPDGIEAIVVGIGINVCTARAEFPPELRDIATSLHAEGGAAGRTEVFIRLAQRLEESVGTLEEHGFAALRDAWNSACVLRGKPVEVLFGDTSRQGIVDGLDEDGYLLLRTGAGVERIVAGDVSVKK
jgi:BirA family biotin operon repressor/biotin-[acetyl-CoA-carboxylase] ligase